MSEIDARMVAPSDEEVILTIQTILKEQPGLAGKKIQLAILTAQPTWIISEKRVKKFLLTMRSLRDVDGKATSGSGSGSSPVSNLVSLPLNLLPESLQIRMVSRSEGKGLFATRDIPAGTIMLNEKAFLYFPGWESQQMIKAHGACGMCAHLLPPVPTLLESRCRECSERYCSRVCEITARKRQHLFECPGRNSRFVSLANYGRAQSWSGIMGVARAYTLLLSAAIRDPKEAEELWAQWEAFATASQEDRQSRTDDWEAGKEAIRAQWKTAYEYTKHALQTTFTDTPAKKSQKNPSSDTLLQVPTVWESRLWDFDRWLRALGRYNLNNQDGGMFLVHASVNHDCRPNTKVEHPLNGSNYALRLRAVRDIRQNEQISITYLNPRMNKASARQAYLSQEYLFDCACQRCKEDSTLTPEELRALGATR